MRFDDRAAARAVLLIIGCAVIWGSSNRREAWAQVSRGAAAAPVTSASARTPIDAWWRRYLARRIGPASAGYAWVILQNGAVVSEGGAGAAAIDSTGRRLRAMSPQTRMQIASASKPITATALLLLLGERGISVDTPFVSLLPSTFWPYGRGVDRVTIRNLLTHRSGYPFGYVYSPRVDSTKALLARDLPLSRGDTARYSNINYSIARTLIEVLAGTAYDDFVRQRLFAPAQVRDAGLAPAEGDAFAHRFAPTQLGAPLALDFTDEAGAYGWYMSASDLARWGESVRSGALLSAQALARAQADSLGWTRFTTAAGTAYGHQGQWVAPGDLGVRTGIVIFPNGVVAVLFINTNVPVSPPMVLVDGFNASVPTFVRQRTSRAQSEVIHIVGPEAADEIRYTLDGSEPTTASLRYTAPLAVTLPARIRARGFTGGQAASATAELAIPARTRE